MFLGYFKKVMEKYLAPKYFKKCYDANKERVLYEIKKETEFDEISDLIEKLKIRKKYWKSSLLGNSELTVS